MPYVQFVISMLDAPQVDYETKKEGKKETNKKPFGTPISQLDAQTLNSIR